MSLYAHTLSALRHHNTCKLLTDQRLRQLLPEEDQRWIAEKWIPQAIAECTYSHCAILESLQESHRAGARNVGSMLSSPMKYQYFQREEEASKWLQAAR
jgi:hypothetical protein